ncbi:MAG: STN domain-containing protein [Gammaproteobacteria bacterium]
MSKSFLFLSAPGRAVLAIVAAGLAWALVPSGGAQGAEAAVYPLHIASQPLDGALQEFARQSGIQIIYFSRLTDGLRAPALDGSYTIDAAMAALLAESQLSYRVINSKTIEIGPPQARSAPGKPAAGPMSRGPRTVGRLLPAPPDRRAVSKAPAPERNVVSRVPGLAGAC